MVMSTLDMNIFRRGRFALLAVLAAISGPSLPAMAQSVPASQGMVTAYLPDSSLAMPQNFEIRPVAENYRTYLVNGLASGLPFIGYGFEHLKKKLDNARHYAYMTPVEGRVVIQPKVLADIKRDHRADPSAKINLVGISYGANIVTALARQLERAGINVNYMAVLDGPMPSRISSNVGRVDNFVCRIPGCMGARLKLERGNKNTILQEFTFRTTHVGLADYAKVHDRILGQLTEYQLNVATHSPVQVPVEPQIGMTDTMTTSGIAR